MQFRNSLFIFYDANISKILHILKHNKNKKVGGEI